MRTLLISLVLAVFVLGGCAAQADPPMLPPLNAATTGPLVTGKLKGETATATIPFSDYTSGNPVIATEAYVDSKVGPAAGASNNWTAPQTFSAGATAALPTVSIAGGNPQLGFNLSVGGHTDTRRWVLYTNGAGFAFSAQNDAGAVQATPLYFTRAGTSFGAVPILGPTYFQRTITAKTSLKIYTDFSTAGGETAPKALGATSEYLRLGGLEWGVGSYRMIGFGYSGTDGNAPVAIGYQETVKTQSTQGDAIIATRSATGDLAPQVRFRVRADGQIMGEGTYAPTQPLSLTTKAYVDARKATAQPDSAAADVATLRAEVNALMAKLRAAGLMAP